MARLDGGCGVTQRHKSILSGIDQIGSTDFLIEVSWGLED
jgi:hypothetical protein